MRFLTADYIFPISFPPIKNGLLVIDDEGRIIEIHDVNDRNSNFHVEYFEGILCPGFINSHCHLELSYLRGRLSEKKGLPQFIAEIDALRRNFSNEEMLKAIENAENEMLKNGIVGVGDVCNSDITFRQKSKGRIRYHSFIEALGFQESKADAAFEKCRQFYLQTKSFDLQASITPHAPYSASEKLVKKISAFACEHKSILSIHNQENEDENKMFISGKGKILERLGMLGIDISDWRPTGKNSLQSIVPFLPGKSKILFVHNTFSSKEDIKFLKSYFDSFPAKELLFNEAGKSQISFCFCPSANLYIENRVPDFQQFVEEGCTLTIGTDSLASNHSLSILEELKAISTYSPEISLQTLLRWATINGAEFFGWENELGTLEKGKKPGLNWIKNVNLKELKLTGESELQRIC